MKEHLHEALLKVKRLATPDHPFAICVSLRRVAPYSSFGSHTNFCEFSNLRTAGFRAWPDFSGSVAYPVVEFESDLAKTLLSRIDDKDVIASMLYDNLEPWADTPYGRKRRELLDFLIDWTKP